MTNDQATLQPEDQLAQIRALTTDQLAELGLSEIAYVRPIMMHGAIAFAIHGADGIPVGVAQDRDLASITIEQRDMIQGAGPLARVTPAASVQRAQPAMLVVAAPVMQRAQRVIQLARQRADPPAIDLDPALLEA